MDIPHGGELGVFTPRGRYLYLVPFAARSPRRHTDFTRIGQLRLRTSDATAVVTPAGPKQPLFTDSGTYQFQLSQEAELSATLVCRVTFVGTTR